MVRLTATLALAALLAGCAATPGTTTPGGAGELPPPEAPPPDVPDAAPPQTEAPARPAPSVSLALRTESARAAASGNTSRAMDLLERAIRIEPDRAELWFDLAELHLSQGDALGAGRLVEKGASLTAGDGALERRARRLRERVAAAGAAG
ncbi:MAG: tetratricopeptide repeat protein [Pseudomonadales bacterium]|jgi:hypothetical protein|nr:tetratricopeptide repeat protein [Pseudomonadales bacterium]